MKVRSTIIFFIIVSSCSSSNKEAVNTRKNIGIIKSVSIEYYFKDELNCNVNRLVFEIELPTSFPDSSKIIPSESKYNLCQLDKMNPKLEIVLDSLFEEPISWSFFPRKMSYKLVVTEYKKNFNTIQCVLVDRIYGSSLSKLDLMYKEFLISNFSIKTINNTSKNYFFKSKDFNIRYKLNGKEIDPNDSISMNASDMIYPEYIENN